MQVWAISVGIHILQLVTVHLFSLKSSRESLDRSKISSGLFGNSQHLEVSAHIK